MDSDSTPHVTPSSEPHETSLDHRLSTLSEQLADPAAPWQASASQAMLSVSELARAASLIGEMAREFREDYVRVHADGDAPTPAQALALARLLRNAFARASHPSLASARVALADPPRGILQVHVSGEETSVSIDREGRVQRPPRGSSPESV